MALAVQFGEYGPIEECTRGRYPQPQCIVARLHAAFGTLPMLTEIAWLIRHSGTRLVLTDSPRHLVNS